MKPMPVRVIAFVSTMSNAPWGGSEYLWSQAARHLHDAGHRVMVSVCGWAKTPPAIQSLMRSGISITERRFEIAAPGPKLLRKGLQFVLRRLAPRQFAQWLKAAKPELVCISNGCFGDDLKLIEVCVRSGVPYVLVAHANAECMWPDDAPAQILLTAYRGAAKAFFVAQANHQMLETQLGVPLLNAELVRNPVNVRRESSAAWPSQDDGLRLACVARLHPKSKGQDLLLQLLAMEVWRARKVSVSLYGQGDSEQSLRRLAQTLNVQDRVRFCGSVSDVDAIWETHHALVLPSRYEGLPISIVEAMLCQRPVIATKVGGNAEVIDDGVTGFIAASPTLRDLHMAMERAWQHRHGWRAMGEVAALKIKTLVPEHAGAVFAERLLSLCDAELQRQALPAAAAMRPAACQPATSFGDCAKPQQGLG